LGDCRKQSVSLGKVGDLAQGSTCVI
jgi:hypothetical protein